MTKAFEMIAEWERRTRVVANEGCGLPDSTGRRGAYRELASRLVGLRI